MKFNIYKKYSNNFKMRSRVTDIIGLSIGLYINKVYLNENECDPLYLFFLKTTVRILSLL